MRAEKLPWPEARSVLRLALPIALTQIGMVLYGTVDMLFVGRLGPGAVAAVGLGAITYFTNINGTQTMGTANFLGGIAPGQQTFFSLEGPPSAIGTVTPMIPEPSSLLMAAIARKQEMKVTEEDIEKGLQELAQARLKAPS